MFFMKGESIRAIVADDDASLSDLLSRVLKNLGHDVRWAKNGAEALALQKELPADLLVTDIIMPEKEGIETILEFRKTYPRIKIVAISGGGSLLRGDAYLSLAERVGANVTLLKPFRNADFVTAVRKVLASSDVDDGA